MNKIYYWAQDPQKLNIGHASLDISFGRGPGKAEYVSWWPGEMSAFLPGSSQVMSNYADDRDAEKAEATEAIELRCLDEDRMREAWYKIKKTQGYAFYTNNCASVVRQLLIEGGATLSLTVDKWNRNLGAMSTPWGVISLARMIAASSSVIVRQRNAGWQQEKPGWFDDWGYFGPGVAGDGLIR